MDIHEHQAKAVLKEYGVPVPRGFPAFTVEEARFVCLRARDAGLGLRLHVGQFADVGGGALGSEDPGNTTYAALTGSYNPTMLALAALAVPVVSAVRGPAAGIGCSLALAADFCVASETAYFLQAFVNIGLVPDGGASWMLPRLIGRARATEMMMLGEKVPAATALDWGMIHKVVADDALDATAFALAERLATGPTAALGLMRRGLADALTGDYAAAMLREAESQRTLRGTADSMEGGMAFLQKRKAAFVGR